MKGGGGFGKILFYDINVGLFLDHVHGGIRIMVGVTATLLRISLLVAYEDSVSVKLVQVVY